jgi:hypothetical protein
VVTLLGACVLGGMISSTLLGGPTITIGSVVTTFTGNSTELYVPVAIHNGGYFAVNGVTIDLSILDSAGTRLITGENLPFDVSPHSTQKVNMSLAADLSSVPQGDLASLLTESQNLTLDASLSASIPFLLGASGTLNGTLPWGGLVEGLAFGSVTVSPFNSTYSVVSWPFSFHEDNQYFRLTANVTGTVTDPAGNVVGAITPFSVDVHRGNAYSGTLTAVVQDSALGSGGSVPLTVTLVMQDGSIFQVQLTEVLNA